MIKKLKKNQHPGLILFSSGSTGKSKAVVHDFLPLLAKFRKQRNSYRTITFLLFDHIGGINTLLYIFSQMSLLVAIDQRTPDYVCKMIEKYGVELLPTSPTFLRMMLISEAYKRYSLESLKLITYGTEMMSEHTLKLLHAKLPKVTLKQTYGLSEIGIMRTKSLEDNSLWLKLGGEDFQTKIKDGILFVKAKTAMLGYLNASSPFEDNGWLNTHDKVEVNGEWVKFLGRDTDIINVGGLKVYPADVESVLQEMENIYDVCVCGRENPLLGEVVVAKIILLKPENLLDLKTRIREYCKNRLEPYKIPVIVELVKDISISQRFKKIRD